jgi:hypothetical protein
MRFIFFGAPPAIESIWRADDSGRCANRSIGRDATRSRNRDMLDILLVAGGVGFFVIAILYTLACDRM